MFKAMLDSLVEPEIERLAREQHRDPADPTFLPLHLTGGIGDVVMAVDMCEFLQKRYQLIVYTEHLAAFHYFSSVNAIKGHPQFTWDLETSIMSRFHFHDRFGGFNLSIHRQLFNQVTEHRKRYPHFRSFADRYWTKYFLMSEYAETLSLNRRTFPMFALGFEDFKPSEDFERSTPPRKIITIHDGLDNYHQVNGRATKQWKWEHWNKLVRELKALYPDYEIVQLGAKNSRAIDGVDRQLITKTTITEAFDWLGKSAVHIDGDSGLVHAATRLGVPCVVMWGPTPWKFYGYKANANLTANFCPRACFGVRDNWNDRCPIGFPTPQCMDEITPSMVIEAVEAKIKGPGG